jgi:thiamine biosynthesis lipoprotein
LPRTGEPRRPGGLERRPRERAIRVAEPIDSGGLGKGLGLRWAARAARASLPSGAGLLLDAGGDIVAFGPQPDGGPWRIGIEDPHGGGEPLAVIELRDGAVATSSTAIRRWTAPDGRRVHHLIDPRSGEPGGGGLAAVTVALADPAWAEVWSKALFLAGPSRIGPVARARSLAAWWVGEHGALEMTPAARTMTIWERPIARRRSA